MRYVYFLLILVLISSCAHNNLRLRKVDKRDHIEVAQEDVEKKRATRIANRPEVISLSKEEVATAVVEEKTEGTRRKAQDTRQETQDTRHWTRDSDGSQIKASEETVTTTRDDEPSKAFMVQEALRAEKNAKNARNMMLASFISFIIPIFSIFSLIFFIAGSIYLFLSSRSNYITPRGEEMARTARIMQIVYAVLMLLAIAAVLALIFL